MDTTTAPPDTAALPSAAVADAGLYPEGQPVLLSAGGSAFFDEVVDVLAPRRDPEGRSGRVVEVVLRSGAYITHDDGYYSPDVFGTGTGAAVPLDDYDFGRDYR